MKVTVLLAVHNGGRLLPLAIADVLAQTFVDFELLVVDDASTDETPRVLRRYDDTRLRVIKNDHNVGQVPSLNRGLREARGEYVARLDADDRMLPTRIEKQVAVLDADPRIALVGTWIDVVDEAGRLWSKIRGNIRSYVDLLVAILTDDYPFGHPSLMYRRDVILEIGGYDPTLAPAEDKDLYRRLALSRRDVRVVREPLVRYRRHPAQLSQVQAEHQLTVDRAGQERFLGELVGAGHAAQLRRLLAEGASEEVAASLLLDELLEGARARLALSAAEQRTLQRALAAYLTRRALAAGPEAEETLAWAARSYPPARAARLVLPTAAAARRSGRRLRLALCDPRLDAIRRRARRSRWLRSIYSRLG